MNVVINFHNKDQGSAKILLYLLMQINEGTNYKYFLQYGDDVASLKIEDVLLEFCNKKHAKFSNTMPDIKIPEHFICDDTNSFNYKGNHTNRHKNEKWKHLQWNLCIYKYLNELDHFLMLEPDSVILRENWLKYIEQDYLSSNAPIYGHLKYGKINDKLIPTHWAGSSVYNSNRLNQLNLDQYFYTRFKNPWWEFRNLPHTETANNCFWGPDFSGYDISYDFFLYALFWSNETGSDNPYDWQESIEFDAKNNIICDFNTRLNTEEILSKYYKKISLFHGAKDDHVRLKVAKLFSGSNETHSKFPVGGRGKIKKIGNFLVTLKELKNKFEGETCYIIGNGPSLGKTDLTRLKDKFTFGLNRIYLNYDNMGYEPTFYCVVNKNVIDQFHGEINDLNSLKFISSYGKNKISNKWNTYFVKSLIPGKSPGLIKTLKADIQAGLYSTWDKRNFNHQFETCGWYEGWTVTYCALQAVYYMGFSKVVFVGVDHSFSVSGEPNKEVLASGIDKNHFHSDYFGKGVKWQYPDLKRSEESYKIARRVFIRDGRKILDATIDGKLKVFPKVNYLKVS